MAINYNSLTDFINILEKENELIRIKTKISTELEITEITDRISKTKEGGKALLFENNGTDFPVLINALGSEKRMSLALRVSKLEKLGEQIEDLIKEINEPKSSIFDKLKLLPRLKELSSWLPKTKTGNPPCQENIIKNPDLNILPILKCWPYDGGKFITLPTVHTKDPKTGIRNVGMYRMQVFEKNLTGMHWHKHKTGARHYEEYKKLGQKMPVAVTLGGDPVYTYVATAPMPENIDEYMLAGFIRKKRVDLIKCITQNIEIPFDADFVIEGYVDPQEDLIWEGPFGDHTGFYSLADWYPRFYVTCITHRNNAIYPATIVGIPPMEDAYIAKATERIFLPLIKTALIPEIIDMNIPEAGVAHNLTIVKIKKTFSGQSLKVANALWGAGQMMFNKALVVVDEETDNIRNLKNFVRKALTYFNPLNDTHFTKGPLDVLDHSSTKFAFGSKILFDATKKFNEETTENECHSSQISKVIEKDFTDNLNFIKKININLISENIPIVFIGIDKISGAKLLSNEINKIINLSSIKIIVLIDHKVDITDISTMVWLAANNIEPQRDCWVLENPVSNSSTLFIDGTHKDKDIDKFQRDWPNIIVMDDVTINKINNIWTDLKIGEFVESPSLKFKNLVSNMGAIAE
jgi:4-hydroxy-3-polyprenylbenzoate decarboxylase